MITHYSYIMCVLPYFFVRLPSTLAGLTPSLLGLPFCSLCFTWSLGHCAELLLGQAVLQHGKKIFKGIWMLQKSKNSCMWAEFQVWHFSALPRQCLLVHVWVFPDGKCAGKEGIYLLQLWERSCSIHMCRASKAHLSWVLAGRCAGCLCVSWCYQTSCARC